MPTSARPAFSARRLRYTSKMRCSSMGLPRNSSAAYLACATSIKRPPAHGTPRASAICKRRVRRGLYTTSNTASSAGNAPGAAKSTRQVPLFGYMPAGEALMMTSHPAAQRPARSAARRALHCARRKAPAQPPRLCTPRAPCAVWPPCPESAPFCPPAKRPCGAQAGESRQNRCCSQTACRPRFTTVFTAPMAFASSLTSSHRASASAL